MKNVVTLLGIALVIGCTTVRVRPVSTSEEIRHVCIEENPKVLVADFLIVLEEGFARHGISTEVAQVSAIPEDCEYRVTYTAFRKWDFTTYLSHAELRLLKERTTIASAEFHLRGGGGLAVTKWRSTRAKMNPVIDELLAGQDGSH